MPLLRGQRPRKRVPKPRARARTEVSDRFFRQVVASIRNGVLAITRTGTVAAMNLEARRIFQLSRARTVTGKHYTKVLADHPDIVRLLSGAFTLTHLPNRAELRLKSSRKVIGYTLSRVADARGHATGFVMLVKDLTKVEQLVERERLRDRLAALGEMAAAIAHEVKNPLAGIEVMAGVLRRQLPDSADAQSILNDIIHEAKMANRIVQEALHFVRPIRLERERTSIPDVLRSAIRIAETKIPRGAVSVRLDVDDELPAIDADQDQICQLFTNLVLNALEALGGRGSIRLSARQALLEEEHPAVAADLRPPLRTVVIEVADDGPGVPNELQDRIFHAFFTTKPQGSGLGLAIVRKIVDAHDGRIDMATDSNGTRFQVTLPVSSGHDALATPFRERN